MPNSEKIKMKYHVHGREITITDCEHGIYKEVHSGLTMSYAVLDAEVLVRTLNGIPKDQARDSVEAFRKMADEQSKWQHTPQNIGFPILRQSPEPLPIDEVRGNIQNTRNLMDELLRTLK